MVSSDDLLLHLGVDEAEELAPDRSREEPGEDEVREEAGRP
jgi:hypothetical protein